MSARRVLGVAAVLAIIALAIALWPRDDDSSTGSARTEKQVEPTRSGGGGRRTNLGASMRRVGGTVFLDDAPAPNATVRILGNHGGSETSVTTDASGRFDLGVVVGRYLVVAEVAHATGAMMSIDLRNPAAEPPPDQLRLVAHACDAVLHGTIRDASGGTIAKARIARSERVLMGPGADSGDDGAYELCIAVGGNFVTISADGYADAVALVSVFGKVRRDFELVPEAIVAGRAVRADDGSPVADATILLSRDGPPSPDRLPRIYATSDADGRFRFRGVAAGSYGLGATAPNLATLENVSVVADVTAPVETVQCSLSGAHSIAGHVVDKQKKPIGGARVYVIRANERGEPEDTTTQADGSFAIDSLAPGRYHVNVDDYVLPSASRALELKTADLDVTLEVEALGSIGGRVTRAGNPVEGASVSTRVTTQPSTREEYENTGASATSDADGRFVLRGLRAGTFHVYAESKRVGAFTPGPEVTLANAEAKTGVEVEMNLAGTIAGKVVDQADVPVSGVHLRFSLLHGSDFGEATTAEDGTFKAAALSGGGDYLYEVHGMTSAIEFRAADGKRFPPITVKDGNARVTGVVIKIRYDRLTISGRVLTSAGSGAPDVSITVLRGQDYYSWSGPSGTTDESGAFTIRDLPAGTYSLRAQSGTTSKRVENIAAGAKGVEIRLPALGSIEGTLTGFAKPPVVLAYGGDDFSPSQLHAVVTGNRYAFAKVPVGSYLIFARSDDGYARGEATVTAGKTTVDLESKGFGRVEGRVIDETTKAPIAGLHCASEAERATTNSDGRFRLERVPVGQARISCYGTNAFAAESVTVELNGVAHVELVVTSPTRNVARGFAGLELESQLREVIVKAVIAGGPAERAGVKVGDTIKNLDGETVDGWDDDTTLWRIERHPAGTIVKLTIERDGKDQAIEIKIDPPRT